MASIMHAIEADVGNIWSRRTTMVICEFGDWFFLKAIEADLRIGPLARLGQAQDAWN